MMTDIIIPVYKPDEKLVQLFEGLSNQTVRPDNIILMYTVLSEKDSISPHLVELGQKASELSVYEVTEDEFDHGGTRAEAVLQSEADIVIMMTQDAVPADDKLIENLIAPFKDDSIGAVYARQLPSGSSSPAECFTRGFNYPDESVTKGKDDIEKMGIKAFFCSNVCAAYRRDIYEELGGFIDRTIFNEDMIYAHKLIMNGYKIRYAADARVIHTHEYTAMQQLHRNFDLAVSQADHPEVFGGISSESEGKKYVSAAYGYFKKINSGYLIIPFIWGCCFRYLGYKLGKNYKKLPMKTVRAISMNKRYWTKETEGPKGEENVGDQQQ
ncbi:MAG: glycosyltransferase [Lachnospiraceae bacterium]|nr:glycosyltransferase [Lachnospiraceae bacterium]